LERRFTSFIRNRGVGSRSGKTIGGETKGGRGEGCRAQPTRTYGAFNNMVWSQKLKSTGRKINAGQGTFHE